MVDPISTLNDLDGYATELDTLSKQLGDVDRRFASAEAEYEEWMASFEEGLWQQHIELGAKFPPEKLRQRMGHRQMNAELLGRYMGLLSARKRMEKRISTLKATVEAKRSILSALKVEAEATGNSLRRVS